MPPILWYFLGGILASLVVGAIAYFSVGHLSTPFFMALFGDEAGKLWGRLYRLTLITVALTGALSVKFYGCSGPTDYEALAQSHSAMFQHASSQAEQSMGYLATFLTVAAAVLLATFAFCKRGRQSHVEP